MAKPSYPPISDYGVISDGHAAALVSRAGSIDWCCLPRLDSASCFARLLDVERGGACSVTPVEAAETAREYRDGTVVLVTTHTTGGGVVRVTDAFLGGPDGEGDHPDERRILRVIEGERGTVELEVRVEPRFDYGSVRPWIRRAGPDSWAAIGGDDALLVQGDVDLELDGEHTLAARFTVRAGDRLRLSLVYSRPEALDPEAPHPPAGAELDDRLEETVAAWRAWSDEAEIPEGDHEGVLRSALSLKALANPRTGAIAAAATTSLPETLGGARNWDYRFSWIRDSAFAVRSLAEIGFEAEAEGFRRFVQRSSAGHAAELQVLFGMGGERRLGEQELDLSGYRESAPVRVGNGAAGQLQLDAFGELIGLAWRWHARGHSPDDDGWRFLVSIADRAAAEWSEKDAGLWEWRSDPQHFVHSKALCWSALDRAIALARDCLRRAPTRRWAKARDEIRDAIEAEGFDPERNTYVQALGSSELDSALLLLPVTGYVAWDDPRMVGTVDAVREELGAGAGGLLFRYRRSRALGGKEGAFLACSFWLAECLAHQERLSEAREVFDAGVATANDLGLFTEEWDVERAEALGNVPQGLTHLSHITAALALAAVERRAAPQG